MAVGGTISFGGLVSGLDTKDIVEKLTGLKKDQLLTSVENLIIKNEDTIEAYKPLEAAYLALMQKARPLQSIDNAVWNLKTGVSSDTDKILITGVQSNSATSGTYEIANVTQLAQADRVYFNGVADQSTTQFGTGTITLTYKGSTTNVVIDSSNNTLSGIKNAINDADAGIIANIVNDGDATTPYRLVLTSEDTGADTAITHNINAVLSLVVDGATSTAAVNEPENAEFLLNGLSVSSSSNIVSDVIQGVTFNLLDTNATGTTTITIKQDNDKIAKNIADFLEAFASLRKLLRETTSIDPETGKFGILGQDSTLTQSNVRIGSIFNRYFNSLATSEFKNLSEIGITTDVYGKMQVDSSKLSLSLQDSIESVKSLFQGSTNQDGIAEEMYDYMDSLINPNGLIPKKKDNLSRSILRLKDQAQEREAIVEAYEARLFAKFNKLEQTMSLLQTQQQAIDSFSGVYSNASNRLL